MRVSARVSFRDVAQLVAHYVRDVGVVCSSQIIPTEKRERLKKSLSSFAAHGGALSRWPGSRLRK
jgi:hypothetical protein